MSLEDLPRNPDWYDREPPWQEAWDDLDGNSFDGHPLSRFLIDWPAFWNDDTDDTEWLLEPLFAASRGHAVYAEAKTGKSWVVLAACAALATGRPFLGQPARPPVNVLYVDYEMTAADVRDRLVDFAYGPDDDLSRLHYALLPSIGPLDSGEGGRELAESAQALGVQLVVIDTTGRAVAGDENDADTYRAFYRHTGTLLKRAGIAFVRIDHAGKSEEAGQRGSSAKNDDVDVVVRITNTDDGKQWKATHRRMAWYPEETNIEVRALTDRFEFHTEAKGYPEGTKECLADMKALELPVDVSVRKAETELKAAGKGRRRAIVAAAVRFRRETLTDDQIGDL